LVARGDRQRVGQGSHARGFVGHSPHHAVDLIGADLAAAPVLIGNAADDAQRRAQLMASVSDVAAQLPAGQAGSLFGGGSRLERMLELPEHRVERCGEPPGIAAATLGNPA
jgi:hypothetical protein